MGSFGVKDIQDSIEKSDNALGTRIADGQSNELDIASQYSFSPERLRLFRNDSREFPQYNSVSQFSDNADHYLLSPDAGDTMHIESAESGTYVVNYSMEASWAFQLTQSLSDGDVLRFGPYNGTDGWIVEQRGAVHDDTTVDILESSGGTETTLESDAELDKPTTSWWRYACEFGWYAILNQTWIQTYTNSGTVINEPFATTSNDGSRGPETGNLNLWIEIQADASTTGLGLEVGSMGMVTKGNPTSLTRDKPQYKQVTVSGSTNTWEPFYAIRLDPNDPNVNAQFARLDLLNYGAAANIEVLVVSVDPSKTDASGWGDPDYHHAFNSAMQETTSVSQVPNTSGTQKNLGSSEKPGGHTIASAVDIDGGNASGSASTSNQQRQQKKSVLGSDVVVFLARTGNVDNALDLVWDVDQNW